MAQILVRQVPEQTKATLKARASRAGRSLEEEVRQILAREASKPEEQEVGLGTHIAALFKDLNLTEEDFPRPEWGEPRPAPFADEA